MLINFIFSILLLIESYFSVTIAFKITQTT